MKRRIFQRLRTVFVLPVIVVAALSFLLSACMPKWIDEGSCIYLTVEGKVMVRDVVAKKSREIAALDMGDGKSKVLNGWLNLNQKKDQFVVARVQAVEEKPMLTLDFYSISGMKIESSDPIEVAGEIEEFQMLDVNWSPDGKYVLVTSLNHGFTFSYHVVKKTHHVHQCVGYMLAGHGVWPSANPITPDSKLFIGSNMEAPNELFLVSLESGEKLHEFDMSTLPEETGESLRAKDQHVTLPAYWRGDVLVQPVLDGELMFDVAEKSVEFKQTDRMKKLFAHAKTSERGVVGEISEKLVVELNRSNSDRAPTFDLSIFNLETETRETFDSLSGMTMFSISISADGQRTLLSGVGGKVQAAVLDADGKLIDQFDYAIAGGEK